VKGNRFRRELDVISQLEKGERIVNKCRNVRFTYINVRMRGGGYTDQSLAQPGKKQATATKLGDLFNILPTDLSTLLSPLL
jgi:hypothetical protein